MPVTRSEFELAFYNMSFNFEVDNTITKDRLYDCLCIFHAMYNSFRSPELRKAFAGYKPEETFNPTSDSIGKRLVVLYYIYHVIS